jgi:hypothetical protein
MRIRLLTLVLAVGLGMTSALARPAADPRPGPAVIQVASPSGAAPERRAGTVQDTYEEREMRSRDLEAFTGGHEVIIVSSCVVVVILVLILI